MKRLKDFFIEKLPYGTILAGGAIRRTLDDTFNKGAHDIHDIDLFFTDVWAAERYYRYIFKEFDLKWSVLNSTRTANPVEIMKSNPFCKIPYSGGTFSKLRPSFLTDFWNSSVGEGCHTLNTMKAAFDENTIPIQHILFKWNNDPISLIKNFQFGVNQWALSGEHVYFTPQASWDIANKELNFTPNGKQPYRSVNTTISKFVSLEYTPSSEILEMQKNVNSGLPPTHPRVKVTEDYM